MTTTSQGRSAELAAFVGGLDWTAVPGAVRDLVADHVLDTAGCILAAVGGPSWSAVSGVVAEEGGHPQASAAGCPDPVSARQAAQVNGVLARSLEFDDMAMPDLHPSGVVVPVVLAVGERQRVPGDAVLVAVAAGLEVLVRL